MWPRLVPPWVCQTACVVTLTAGIGEDGAPLVAASLVLSCNWQDKPKQILDAERHLIQLSGAALFDGDIAPAVDILELTSLCPCGIVGLKEVPDERTAGA